MSIEYKIILALSVIVVVMALIVIKGYKRFRMLHFQKRSQSSRYGKMSEQFMPFLDDYPYDPQDFRFLGTPVDGVQFGDEGIIFIEFKSASSQLSTKQRRIRDLINQGKVKFEEHRIE